MAMTSTERGRKWRAANHDRAKANQKDHQERNGDAIRARASMWSRNNPDRRKAIKSDYDDRRRNDLPTWARHMANALKCRCKKASIPYDLSAEYMLSLVPLDGICPAIGIPIIFGGHLTRNSPSVDRIVPSEGYVRGNIRIISFKANAMKQDCSDPAEMRRLADYIESTLNQSEPIMIGT